MFTAKTRCQLFVGSIPKHTVSPPLPHTSVVERRSRKKFPRNPLNYFHSFKWFSPDAGTRVDDNCLGCSRA